MSIGPVRKLLPPRIAQRRPVVTVQRVVAGDDTDIVGCGEVQLEAAAADRCELGRARRCKCRVDAIDERDVDRDRRALNDALSRNSPEPCGAGLEAGRVDSELPVVRVRAAVLNGVPERDGRVERSRRVDEELDPVSVDSRSGLEQLRKLCVELDDLERLRRRSESFQIWRRLLRAQVKRTLLSVTAGRTECRALISKFSPRSTQTRHEGTQRAP